MLFTRVCPQLVFLYKKKEYNLNVSILSTDVHNSVQIVKYERYQNLNLKFEKRFDALNSKYLKSLKNKNELIKDLLIEYCIIYGEPRLQWNKIKKHKFILFENLFLLKLSSWKIKNSVVFNSFGFVLGTAFDKIDKFKFLIPRSRKIPSCV